MGPWWLTWHLCLYICEKCEMSRLWHTNTRTDEQWKVGQYSVGAESAIERSNSSSALSFQTFVLVYKRRRALRVWLGIGSLSLGLIINSTITWIFYKEEEKRRLRGRDTWNTELELCRLLEDAVFLISTTSRGCNPWQLPRNSFGNEKIDV